MKTKLVKDIMVPLGDYATVSKDASLYDAVIALRKAQEEFDEKRYRHRAVLVFDEKNHIVGKISQLDVLRALEPKYDEIFTPKKSFHLGFTRQFQKNMLENLRLWDGPMERICQKAAEKKVSAFMYDVEENECIKKEASLDEAIHQFVIGSHQSLLVQEKKEIVGILRLTDVFQAICDAILSCKL